MAHTPRPGPDPILRDQRIAELGAELVALREELDSHDDYTLCDCCQSLTLEPVDAGDHMQCVSCTELAELAELRGAARALLGNKKLMHMHGAICIIGAPADNWDALAAALLEVKDAPEAPRIKQDWQVEWEKQKRK